MEIEKKQIIIDTDPGHDDALAIFLLEKSGMFDIKAITTVAGNSTIQNTTNNARFILDLINSKTPIYSGASRPLKRELVTAVVHGESGLEGAEIVKHEEIVGDAYQKIIEIVRDNPGKISILAIGPETNIAKAFIKDPRLPSLIKEVVIMGGAISVPGNKNRVAEFNIFVDPEAAEIVFNADVKKTLIPLDICNEVFLKLKDFYRLKNSPLYGPVEKMMGFFIEGIRRHENNNAGAIMYDPVAAYYLLNPKAFKTEMMDVRIETQSELTLGMTVADKRNWGDKKLNVNVAISVNKSAFTRDFFKILSS